MDPDVRVAISRSTPRAIGFQFEEVHAPDFTHVDDTTGRVLCTSCGQMISHTAWAKPCRGPTPPTRREERERMRIQIGQGVRDRITGFEGRVTGRCEYLTGCAQVLIQPPTRDGAWVESRWMDEPRLLVTEAHPIQIDGNDATKGADAEAPRK